MSELEQTARKIGFLLEGYAQATDNQVLRAWARELMASSLPENQSPHDSTETVEGNQKMSAEQLEEFEREVNEASVAYEAAQNEPVQPMADLSGEETWSKLEEINERNFPDLRPNGGYTPPPAETD